MSASYLDQILGAQVSATSKHLPLASFAVEISKGTTPLSFGYPYTVDGVPFVTAEDLAENGVAVDSVTRCVSDECHAFLRRSQLEPNDVLISIAGTLGRVSFMPEDSRPANCNQAVCFIRLNQSLDQSAVPRLRFEKSVSANTATRATPRRRRYKFESTDGPPYPSSRHSVGGPRPDCTSDSRSPTSS